MAKLSDSLKTQIQYFQTPEEVRAKAEKLPEWVKCMKCGGRPKLDDWLVDLMSDQQGMSSNVLIHESCAAADGKFIGLNIGEGVS